MRRWLFNIAYLSLLGVTLPFWIYKALTTGKYRAGLGAKLLGTPLKVDGHGPLLWLHAVSVGEVMLLRPLVAALQKKRSDLRLALSVSTNTGFAVARQHFADLAVFYAPLDFSWAIGRVLKTLKPDLIVLAELELWPNLLIMAKRSGVPVAVVNARMSERSFRGYSRFRRLLAPSLQAIDWWGAQTRIYSDRIHALVAGNGAEIVITGSMKYDGALSDRRHPKVVELGRLLSVDEGQLIFIAGSTMDPEEESVVEAFATLKEKHPRLRLFLAPRHRERFDEVASLLKRRGAPFVRRSTLIGPEDRPSPIVLVDSIGELAALWGLADVGFVGGSLYCKRGGQSMIEPAAFGVPVCFGPNTWNFADTVERLRSVDGAVVVSDGAELTNTLDRWLSNPDERIRVGSAAREFVASQQGSVERTVHAILSLITRDETRHRAQRTVRRA